jgi:signal transduction histidine kinase
MKAKKKTKQFSEIELKKLCRRIVELDSVKAAQEKTERELLKLSGDLKERVKELDCLLGISRLRDRQGATWDHVFQGIVELIPPAWQYPEVTCARMKVLGQEFRTSNFRETRWRQTADVRAGGKVAGTLDVYYLEGRPSQDEGPFLKEERNLLNAVAERIERMIQHKQAEESARQGREQLVHLDKMAALGTLVSGVAHEINNPNNFIMLNAPVLSDACKSVMPILDEYYAANGEFLMGGLPYSEMRENIPALFSGIFEGAKRIKNIVDNLKGFARVETPDMTQSVDMNAVVKSALGLLGNLIRKSTRNFTADYAGDPPVLKGNFQRIEQVVVNLVQNACEALPDRHKGIRIKVRSDRGAQKVVVTVQDEGVGIPANHLPHVLDPFFTTKRNIGGTGLGLSVSSGIVNDHGGSIDFASTVGKGTTVTLTLPMENAKGSNGGTRK